MSFEAEDRWGWFIIQLLDSVDTLDELDEMQEMFLDSFIIKQIELEGEVW